MVVAVEYISKEESAGVEAAKHGVTGILAVQGAFAEHAAMLDHSSRINLKSLLYYLHIA